MGNATLTGAGWLVDEIDRQLVQYDAETQSLVSGDGLWPLVDAGGARTTVGVVTFGDSLSQNAIYSDGTETVAPPRNFVDSALNNNWRGWGYAAWLGPLSMQRIQLVKNYAVQTNGLLTAGTTPAGHPLSTQVTAYLADRASGTVKASRAIIMVGTNDSASTIAACTAELLTQIARLNMPVDLMAAPPRGGTVTTVVGDGMQLWAWLMEWRAICKRIAENSGGRVRFIDTYPLVNSPTTVPDVLAAGYTYDNIHSNNSAAYRWADAYVSAVLPSSLAGDLDLWPNNSSAATSGANNLLDQGIANPIMGTTSGGTAGTGASGTVAASFTATGQGTGTVVCSVISNPNGIGNMQRMVITSNAAADGANLTTADFKAAGGTFLTAGDECWVQALVTVNTGGILPRHLRLHLLATDGSSNYFRMCMEIDAAKEVALPITATRSFLFRTPKFVMPAGFTPTSMTGVFRAAFAAAGSCTIDIGNFECRRFRSGGVYA